MREIINVHCHVLNFDFVPDSFFKTRAPIRERLLRRKLTGWIARGVTFLIPGRKYNKLHQLLDILKKDIDDVAEELVREMEELEDPKIVLSTPLMMDLEIASFNKKPECPYRYQVLLLSSITARKKGKILPFIMFDPRRKSASELMIKALEEMGFLGVKMYPALGYHPDPSSFYNDDEVNHELEKIYKYCQANSIPITAHCSEGGAYSSELMHYKKLAHEFSQPSSWEGVLENYSDLYLNLAHFGGNDHFLEIDDGESWTNRIVELMNNYKNVYADISYHNGALTKKSSEGYFEILKKLIKNDLVKERILFGTDWLMTRHTWKEKEYLKNFIESLGDADFKRITFENPLDFLFPGKKLPSRIKHFFQSNGVGEDQLPSWKDNLEI